MENRYLYRAKRIDNGEWVEGFYFCMTHPDGRHTHHFIIPLGTNLNLGTPIEKIQVEIDPSTLCKCTGFEDVRDQIIWENDVVLLWDKEKEGCDDAGPYVVRWSKEHGKFEVKRPCCYTGYYPESATKVTTRIVEQEEFDFSGRTPQMVVIGNTIDNDELRKMDWEEAEAMLKERKGSHDGE